MHLLVVASLVVPSREFVSSLAVASVQHDSLLVASLVVSSLAVTSVQNASLLVASLVVASLVVASVQNASLLVESLVVASLVACLVVAAVEDQHASLLGASNLEAVAVANSASCAKVEVWQDP